jgi:hypothetical protein
MLLVGAAIGIGLGFFSLNIHNIYISASLVFIIPLGSVIFVKKICVQPVTLLFTDTMLMISKIKTDITIPWENVEGYRIKIVSGLLVKGVTVTFINKNNTKQSLCFTNTKVTDGSGNLLKEGILFSLCSSIKSYNSHINENYAVGIYPIPKPLNNFLFAILSFLAAILVIFDLYYRSSHPQQTNTSLLLIMVSIIIIISAFATKAKNKKFFKQIDELYEEIILK